MFGLEVCLGGGFGMGFGWVLGGFWVGLGVWLRGVSWREVFWLGERRV